MMGEKSVGLWVWEAVLLEVNAAVGELAERSLLLDLGRLSGVLLREKCQFAHSSRLLPLQVEGLGML